MAVLYTSSAHQNGSQGLIWGEADYTQTNNSTYTRITLTWLGECWQGVSQYEGTTYTSYTGTITAKINGTSFSGSISGYRSHSVSSTKYEYSASDAPLGYVDVARGHSSKTVTISLTYKIEGSTYTGSTTVTIPALASYTVSYNANGGSSSSVPSAQTKYYGETLTLSSTKPTRTGYTFSKWNTKSDGTGTAYSSGGSYTSNASATLYARWTANTYTVSYSANGGSGAPSSQTKAYGVALTLSSTKPTKTGYTFSNWKATDGTTYASGGSYTKNEATTLTAQWTANTYTVTYNANGGSGAPSSQTKYYGTDLTLRSETPTKSGYTFVGWGTATTSTSAKYQPGGKYTSNASATLYAVWKKTITISYSLDGGSGGPSSESKTIYNSTTSASFTIPSTKPTKANYIFTGWKVGSTSTIKQPGDSVSLSASTTLTAQWTADYIPPKFGKVTAYRTNSAGTVNDGSGTYGYLNFTWTSGSNGGTTLATSVSAKYRAHGSTSSWTTITNSSQTANRFTAVFGGSLSSDTQYDISLSLQDTGQTAVTYTTFISTEAFTIDVNADGTAVSFFKVAPNNGAGVYVNGGIRLDVESGVGRWITTRQNDTSVLSSGVGTTGVHGLYSEKGSRWMIQAPADGSSVTINDGTSSHTYVAGDLTVQGHDSAIGTVVESQNSSATVVPSGTVTTLMSITLDPGVWVIRVLVRFPAMGTDRTKYCSLHLTTATTTTTYLYRQPCENMITQIPFTQIVSPDTTATYNVLVYHNSGSDKTFAAGSAIVQNIRAVRIA